VWLLRLLYVVPLRLRSILRRSRVEHDLDDEIRDHLERRIEAEVARGTPPEEARRAALRAFGGVEQGKEACRDMRHVTFIDHRRQDVRFAIRQLLKHRTFAFTAITVLTLGIGGSVAIFGFVDAALITPLPYRDPSRLVSVFGAGPDAAPRQQRGGVSLLDFLDWRSRSRAFESMAAYDVRAGFTMVTATGPQRVSGLRVTSGFFRTLGVTPVLGREFTDREEGVTAPPAVMLSYSAWQTRFGGSPDILGRTITLQSPWLSDAEPHVIVGVLPRGFHFTLAEHAEFWATIRGQQACWNVRSCQSLEAIARVASGSTIETATTDATTVIASLRREYPEHHRDEQIARLVLLRDVMLGSVRPVLLMLLGGAGLLLVIACLNLATLLLARADARTREIAMRRALGASRSRILAQFATEAVVLTSLGAAGGVVIGQWTIALLTTLLSPDMLARMPYLQVAGINGRVMALAALIALAAASIFAIVPAARVSAARVALGFPDAGRGVAGTHWRRFGAPLVVLELAVAVILLVGAGLLGKSFYRLLHHDPGFNPQGVTAISVTPVSSAGPRATPDSNAERPGVLAQRVAARVALLPGVRSVGYADQLPLSAGIAPATSLWLPDRSPADQIKGFGPVRRVSARYFQTLETRLIRGRYFTDDEVAAAALVLVINETAARRYFADDDPIGRSVTFGGPTTPRREIVGIIADIKDGPPEMAPLPSAYVPYDQTGFSLVARMEPGASASPTLVAAIREVVPDALVGRAATMRERLERLPAASLNHSTAWLVGGFAAMAFVLSIVGLYGVVAYSVGQRTREIGVRMALGAPRESVSRMVLWEAARVIGLGAALGLIGAVLAASAVRGLLFDVRTWDPQTLVIAAVALVGSALAASYIPARRAASVNPIEVLRGE
jgi:macrolide transport system ATP-binding/permease protein